MERLDQGHLFPKLEVPRPICLSRELKSGLTLAKSYLNSVLVAIRNIYKQVRDMATHRVCDYMNIHGTHISCTRMQAE